MKLIETILCVVVLTISVVGCKEVSTGGAASQADMKATARGNTAFAIDLYHQMCRSEGNLFFSPYSISTNLALVYGGARGDTEKQMTRALHFSLPQERLHRAFGEMQARLSKAEESGGIKLSLANSLWPQNGTELSDGYLSLVRKHYNISITPIEYGNTRQAADMINQWVEGKSVRAIRNVIGPGVFGELTSLVLVNAIYFKGAWEAEFNPSSTRDDVFYVTPVQSLRTPMMCETRKTPYGEADGLQVLELPFAGNSLSMLILLPQAKDGLSQIEGTLSIDTLSAWKRHLKKQDVTIYMPKFAMDYGCDLRNALEAMGVVDLFKQSADLSGMTKGNAGLYVSAVVHHAFVKVDEEGAEASATTLSGASAGRRRSQPIPVFRVDHPFLFLIQSTDDGDVLFLGRVTNPSE